MTCAYDKFRRAVDTELEPDGDTRLYDALYAGAEKLVIWKNSLAEKVIAPPEGGRRPNKRAKEQLREKREEHANKIRIRMICFSDGSDQTSFDRRPWQVAKYLQQHGIILDVVAIGDDRDPQLHHIAKATGGYCFNPVTMSDALRLNELEVFLSSWERPPVGVRHRLTNVLLDVHKVDDVDGLRKFASQPLDICNDDEVPKRKQVKELGASRVTQRLDVSEFNGMTSPDDADVDERLAAAARRQCPRESGGGGHADDVTAAAHEHAARAF